MATVTSIGLQV